MPKSASKKAKKLSKSRKVDLSVVSSPNQTRKIPGTPHPARVKNQSIFSKPEISTSTNTTTKKANDSVVAKPAAKKRKIPKVIDYWNTKRYGGRMTRTDDDILKEEERRFKFRNERTLFVKNVVPYAKKISVLKSLHPDIWGVRVTRKHAWLMFRTAEQCANALELLSKAKLKGRLLDISYAKRDKTKYEQRPINRLEITIAGIPKHILPHCLRAVFHDYIENTQPSYWKNPDNSTYTAFLRFKNEKDAMDAFEKGKSLTIGSLPVEVFFSRLGEHSKKSKKQKKKDGSITKSSLDDKVEETPQQEKNETPSASDEGPAQKRSRNGQIDSDDEQIDLDELIAQKQRELDELKEKLTEWRMDRIREQVTVGLAKLKEEMERDNDFFADELDEDIRLSFPTTIRVQRNEKEEGDDSDSEDIESSSLDAKDDNESSELEVDETESENEEED